MSKLADRTANEVPVEVPVFVTEENRAALRAIHDERLRRRPVPFATRFVDTR